MQRMALSYIIGSHRQGYLGNSSSASSNNIDSSILLSESDVDVLLEVLSNTLNCRGKAGPAGYSVVAFSVKSVVFALRCMLTHVQNQKVLAALIGPQLNTLLIKALALHCFGENETNMDTETAEHVAFSLYLLSSHAFRALPFLPCSFVGLQGDQGSCQNDKKLRTSGAKAGESAAKIFFSYLCLEDISAAGRHAAEQLLLRMPFLSVGGEMKSITGRTRFLQPQDLAFHLMILTRLEEVQVGKLKYGATPSSDILYRQIACSPLPQKKAYNGAEVSFFAQDGSVTVFANAILAAQHISFGSVIAQQANSIDEIRIANTLAESANRRSSAYGYLWYWEEYKFNNNTPESDSMDTTSRQHHPHDRCGRSAFVEAFSIIGLQLCAVDTTTK
jgi:hypothetical protein